VPVNPTLIISIEGSLHHFIGKAKAYNFEKPYRSNKLSI